MERQANRIPGLEVEIIRLRDDLTDYVEKNTKLEATVAAAKRGESKACDILRERIRVLEETLTFNAFRQANVARCLKWHPAGIESWSTSDWMTTIVGELGEAASLIKMRNRERDGLPGNKFSPTDKQIADEIADIFTYLDLFAAVQGIDLGKAVASKFNEVSERVGFPDRIPAVDSVIEFNSVDLAGSVMFGSPNGC